MKRLAIFVIIFSFIGTVFLSAQSKTDLVGAKNSEIKKENIQKVEKEKSEKKTAVKDTAKAKPDTTKAKKKTFIPAAPGGNWKQYQDYLHILGPGEELDKYIGPEKMIYSQSKSGSWTKERIVPGTPVITKEGETEDIKNFFIFQCYNQSKIAGKAAGIKKGELIKVVSFSELEQLRQGTGIAGIGKEDLKKLTELLERSFGDGGEIELMGDNLIALNGQMDSIQKEITSLRALLGLKGDGEKVESSSSWWKWALGAVGVVALGVITYKLLDHKDAAPVSIIINTAPTGGPANPNN